MMEILYKILLMMIIIKILIDYMKDRKSVEEYFNYDNLSDDTFINKSKMLNEYKKEYKMNVVNEELGGIRERILYQAFKDDNEKWTNQHPILEDKLFVYDNERYYIDNIMNKKSDK